VDTISEKGASPQTEDGHIDIANEIGEALARLNLSAYESRILWVIWRKTYGWHKKVDCISFTQFEKATGLHRRHVQRTIKKLIERNIIASTGYSRILSYGFQKDYTKWRDVASTGASYPKEATHRSLKRLIQKKLTKERIMSIKKMTDPKVKEFLTYWGEVFQREIGQPYSFSYEKDGRLTKDLLKLYSLETLQDVTERFFNDEWCKEKGFSFGLFKSQFGRLLSKKAINKLDW
jgi:phage replication O-like protein O